MISTSSRGRRCRRRGLPRRDRDHVSRRCAGGSLRGGAGHPRCRGREQPFRGYPDRFRRCSAGIVGAARVSQSRSGAPFPEHVRAGPWLSTRACGPGSGEPTRGDLGSIAAARPSRRGRECRPLDGRHPPRRQEWAPHTRSGRLGEDDRGRRGDRRSDRQARAAIGSGPSQSSVESASMPAAPKVCCPAAALLRRELCQTECLQFRTKGEITMREDLPVGCGCAPDSQPQMPPGSCPDTPWQRRTWPCTQDPR